MTNFTNDFKKLDKFLYFARTSDSYSECKDILELFEIKNKDASYPEIESQINKFVGEVKGSNAPKFKLIGKNISNFGETLKRILKDHRKEYYKYIQENDPKIKELKIHFKAYTKHDLELDSEEKKQLLKEAKEIGLSDAKAFELINQWLVEDGVKEAESHSSASTSSAIPFDVILNKTYYEILGVSEDADYADIKKVYDDEHKKYINARDKAKATARWVPVSEAWECLRDNNKRKKYDEKQRRKIDKDLTAEGDPKLEIEDESGKERRNYEFKDMRLGTTQSVTVLAKNGGGGTLDAKIKTSHPWLIVDTDKIHQSKLPQYITITVDPKKNPKKNTFGGKDTGEIKINDKNGGDPYIVYIAYNIEEDVKDLKRFRQGVTIGGLVLGFILGSQIYNIIEGTSYKITAEYAFLIALIVIVIVGSKLGYKDSGGGGAFGWGCGTFVGGLIILSILKAYFPHTFSTAVWSLIYGSIAYISSDFIRPAIRQKNYQVPIGIGVGVLVLTVMVIIIGAEGARKERNAELARSEARQNIYRTISTGDWEGYVGNTRAKLTINSNGNGYIIYDNIKESLTLNVYDLAYEKFVLKGTNYERLRGKGNFSLDTFYGRISKDGRSISGNYVDTAGNKGNWSVTKHKYTYKTPPQRTSTTFQESRIKIGKYTKGNLGISAQSVTTRIQETFGLKDCLGALVSDIEPNSPAANTGIKSGDIMIKYNGSKIRDPYHFLNLVAAETDKELEFTIIRDGKELTLNSASLESPKTRNAKVVEDTEAEINNGMDRSIKERKVKAPLNSSSLFACRNSRIYHKSNCSKLSSDDLIEFTSFLKARDAGGIPCEYCNPSAFSGNNTFKAGSTNIYEITSQVQDSNKFDIHYRVFSSTFQKTWYSVIQVLNKQKEKGIQQKKDKGVIITDLTRHGIYGFPKYDKYYVVIAPLNSSSTKVSLKLFTYYRDMKDRKFTDIVLLPEEDKVYMNKRAKKFLNKITKSLANRY